MYYDVFNHFLTNEYNKIHLSVHNYIHKYV